MIFHFRQSLYWMLAFGLACAVTYWLPDSPRAHEGVGYVHVLTGLMATACFLAGTVWGVAGLSLSIDKATR
jgi:hypothetical protein